MAESFHKIGLIGKYAAESAGDALLTVADYLKQRDLPVMVDEMSARVWPGHGLEIANRDKIGRECDLAIVIGGDGTMLNVARSLAGYDIAILGINLGWLGFLTDISPDELEQRLDEVFAGQFVDDERFLLHCTIIRNGEQINESEALNDVVVHKWDVARMIEIDTYINGTFVNTLRSDGLIVSTPTGSTAYALSGGGPIMQPCLDAVILVPICPHTLSNRPIVIDAGTTIEIIVKGHEESRAQVTCDGQINLGLVSGDRIRIRRKEHNIRLIHPVDHDHFHILREKLGWG